MHFLGVGGRSFKRNKKNKNKKTKDEKPDKKKSFFLYIKKPLNAACYECCCLICLILMFFVFCCGAVGGLGCGDGGPGAPTGGDPQAPLEQVPPGRGPRDGRGELARRASLSPPAPGFLEAGGRASGWEPQVCRRPPGEAPRWAS